MKLFLSHSSNDKSLVRDIVRRFPGFLSAWMDETHLKWGSSLQKSLRSAIQVESDFVIVFIGKDAVA